MSINEEVASRPRVLILGSTGRIGSNVIAELERINVVKVVHSSRKLEEVEAWRRDGKDAAAYHGHTFIPISSWTISRVSSGCRWQVLLVYGKSRGWLDCAWGCLRQSPRKCCQMVLNITAANSIGFPLKS